MISLPVKLAAISAVAIIIIASAYAASLALNSPEENNMETTPSPSNSPSPTVSATSPSASKTPAPTQHNESAIYTFTVTPYITSYESYWNSSTNGDLLETTYHITIQITWDKNQAPYVRYYEITPHFNGNSKPTQNIWGGSTEFREWGIKPWAPVGLSSWVENEIYFIGSGALTYPNPANFRGIFDNSYDWQRDGLHGLVIGSMTTTYEWKFADSGATAADLEQTEKAMDAFAKSYFEGWTFTVKPVS
jgi:hypothetical protein